MPKSCCRPRFNESLVIFEGSGDEIEIDCEKSQDPTIWWERGCAQALQMWISGRLHIVGAVALIIFIIQVLVKILQSTTILYLLIIFFLF